MDASVKGEYQLYSPLTDTSILFSVLIIFANRINMSPGPSKVNTKFTPPLMKICVHLGLKASMNTSFHAQGSKFLYSPLKVLITLYYPMKTTKAAILLVKTSQINIALVHLWYPPVISIYVLQVRHG